MSDDRTLAIAIGDVHDAICVLSHGEDERLRDVEQDLRECYDALTGLVDRLNDQREEDSCVDTFDALR